ncbi:MAG: hypothetical protein ACPL3C_12915 [Pyrobaculum sp.]|uniref:hypothetical protein n=1 Tax=Pyrobaculum sp. TaxID=2004705 RepID=UPI003C991BA6
MRADRIDYDDTAGEPILAEVSASSRLRAEGGASLRAVSLWLTRRLPSDLDAGYRFFATSEVGRGTTLKFWAFVKLLVEDIDAEISISAGDGRGLYLNLKVAAGVAVF